jgi:hypothetical protein
MDAKKLIRPKPHIVFKPECEVYVYYKKQNERVWFEYDRKPLMNCEEEEDD